jgi:hypothetical protein
MQGFPTVRRLYFICMTALPCDSRSSFLFTEAAGLCDFSENWRKAAGATGRLVKDILTQMLI